MKNYPGDLRRKYFEKAELLQTKETMDQLKFSN